MNHCNTFLDFSEVRKYIFASFYGNFASLRGHFGEDEIWEAELGRSRIN